MNQPDDYLANRTELSRGSNSEPRSCPVCGMPVPANLTNCPNDGTVLVKALEMGAAISDKYEIIAELGRGGLGIVYLARQRMLNKKFAIKMLHADAMSPQQIARFHTEARALSKLQHPNLVQIVDFGVADNNQPFMVMQFIEGKTLDQLIARDHGLEPKLAVDIAVQIARAMAYAHSQSVVHRDLKPSNIIISKAGSDRAPPVVHILDFGLAKIAGEESGYSTLTRTGEIFGSPLYMSPEQGQGRKVDERSDVYSLGCILYESIAGSPPISGTTTLEILVNRAQAPAPVLSKTAKGKRVPQPLAGIVALALERDLRKRFQTMSAFEKALTRWRQTGLGILWIDNSAWMVAAVSSIVILICGAFAISLFSSPRDAMPSVQPEAKLLDQSKADGLLGDGLDSVSDNDPNDSTAQKIRNQTGESMQFDGCGPLEKHLKMIQSRYNLKILSIGFEHPANIDDKNIDYIVNLPLRELTLNGCPHLTDEGLKKLNAMQTLNKLQLYKADIDDKGVEYLKPLGPRLSTLWLNGTKITDKGVAEIGRTFTGLTDLALEQDPITGSALRNLQNLKQLDVLNVSSTGIRQTDLEALHMFPRLRELSAEKLGLNGNLTDVLRSSAPQLAVLDIDLNSDVGDVGLQKLATLKNLRELHAYQCASQVAEDSFRHARPDVVLRSEVPEKPLEGRFD